MRVVRAKIEELSRLIPQTEDYEGLQKDGDAPGKEHYLASDYLNAKSEDQVYDAFYMSTESVPFVSDDDHNIGQEEATAGETNGACNMEGSDPLLADLKNIRVRAAIQLGLLAHATSSLCESIPLGVVSSGSLGEIKDVYSPSAPYEQEGSIIPCPERGLIDMVIRDVHQFSSAIMSRFVQPVADSTNSSFSAVKKKQRLGVLEVNDLEGFSQEEFDALSVDSLEMQT